jgi:hypothetical protein
MICQNCGKNNKKGEDFCVECGCMLYDGYSYSDRKPKIKIIIGIAGLLLVAVCFTFAFRFFSKATLFQKDKRSSEISSLCDSGPASNALTGCETVSDSKNLFFKNPYDAKRLYAMDDKGNIKKISEASPMAMFYHEGYIYYSDSINNMDEPGTSGLYKVKTDGSGEELLLSFDIDVGTFILENVYDGKLYFSYKKDREATTDICSLNIEKKEIRELYNIPSSPYIDYACVNVTKQGIYFKDEEGLKKLNEENTQTELIIKDFKADVFTIYKGAVYYVSREGEEAAPVLRKVNLDGKNDELLFKPSEEWASRIEPSVYNDSLFLLVTSDSMKESTKGVLYKCELNGDNPYIVSDKVSRVSINEGNLYYGYEDLFDVLNPASYGDKFASLRQSPMYKRSIGSDGSLGDEEVFFDPGPENRAWLSFDHPSDIYNPDKKDYLMTRTYYYDENGELYKDGWKNIDGEDYCFAEDGHMLCEEFSFDGKFLGKDGKVSSFVAPYKENLEFFADSMISMSSVAYPTGMEEFNAFNGSAETELIEREEVYELTNMILSADQIYASEDVESLKEGDSFTLKGINLTLTVVGHEGYNERFRGECVALKQNKYPDIEFKFVKSAGDNRYALRCYDGKGINFMVFTIYRGSIYFDKEATYGILNFDSKDVTVTPVKLIDYYNGYRKTAEEMNVKDKRFYFKAAVLRYDDKGTYSVKETIQIE